LIKQYKKLFEHEEVELSFTDEALNAIADEAIKRGNGARGLRGVLESSLLDIMYEIPSKDNIKAVIIEEGVITKGEPPKLEYKEPSKMKSQKDALSLKSEKEDKPESA
jgi:ATP-dependent Clp protease ATP-binding subunit ClpX